jgi:phosphoribosylglycinamide formyltransferase
MSSHHPETHITVLISGSGTNLQALIDAQKADNLSGAKITRVISNRKDAYGLKRAEQAQIPTTYHNLKRFRDQCPDDVPRARQEYDIELTQLILKDEPHLIVCAGWMHILSAPFLSALQKAGVHIINLHPALPGQFNGAKAIERAYRAFMDGEIGETGVMIHYVIHEVDMGEPLVVRKVALEHPRDDELAALEERMHGVEHEAIVEGTRKAIGKIWEGKESEK